MDGLVVAVAVPAVAPGVAAVLTAAVAPAVAAAAPASAGAAAAREEPVSKTGDAGCVGRSAVGVGGVGVAVGGALRGGGGGGAWVPQGVEGKSCKGYSIILIHRMQGVHKGYTRGTFD